MAVKTVSTSRFRTECKTFSGALATVEANYNTYESAQAADDTKTITVRVVNAYYDGTNHVIIAEKQWPEINDDPMGQVPELP